MTEKVQMALINCVLCALACWMLTLGYRAYLHTNVLVINDQVRAYIRDEVAAQLRAQAEAAEAAADDSEQADTLDGGCVN